MPKPKKDLSIQLRRDPSLRPPADTKVPRISADGAGKNFEKPAHRVLAAYSRSMRRKIAEVMHSGMTFNTVIGPIAYDKKGDRSSVEFVWFVWQKGDDGKITFKQRSY